MAFSLGSNEDNFQAGSKDIRYFPALSEPIEIHIAYKFHIRLRGNIVLQDFLIIQIMLVKSKASSSSTPRMSETA